MGTSRPCAANDGSTCRLGWSVAISGKTAVVSGISCNPGKVLVFERDLGGTNAWGQAAELSLAGPGVFNFGRAVAVSGNTIVVGASGADNGTGAAYVFERNASDATQWMQATTLAPAIPDPLGQNFGLSAAISGDTAIVGMLRHVDASGLLQKTAYIFSRDKGGADAWGEVAHRRFENSFDAGSTVAIEGDTAIVGSTSGGGRRLGLGNIRILSRNRGGTDAWGEVTALAATDGAGQLGSSTDEFGASVAISGNNILVGAIDRNGELTKSGAGYVCRLDAPGFENAACFRPPATVDDQIAISDLTTSSGPSRFLITATFTNTGATAIRDPFIEVRAIHSVTSENVLENADGGPGGVGSTITPDVGDELLSPGESTTVTFVIDLRTRQPFLFLVSVRGFPSPSDSPLAP